MIQHDRGGWVTIAIAVAFIALAIRAHIQYRREVKRAKQSRWATWLDQPLKTWTRDPRGGGFTATRDDGYD